MTRLALHFLCFVLAVLGCVDGFMSMYALNRLKFNVRPFAHPVNLRMSHSLDFFAGRGTGVEKENLGHVHFGTGNRALWPLHWCAYIVAGYRYVNATMESDNKKKRKILEDLESIYDVVENECYSIKEKWRTPSPEFLTSRKPTLKAAHLTVLIDLFESWFGTSAGPPKQREIFSNALLCRMSKMMDVLHPYLAWDEDDIKGTPFEYNYNYNFVLAHDSSEELAEYCEKATKDERITALLQ